MIARYLLPGEAAQVLEIAREAPSSLAAALEAVTQTLVGYVSACVQAGADGIFYATNMATRDKLTLEECARWQRPYDLRVLEAARGAPFNIMHVCGDHALFDAFVDYPVSAFSWANGSTNPSLRDGHLRTGKASMGGIPNHLTGLRLEDIAERVRSAIQEMDRRWLLLAPGCSVDITRHDELLLAARDAARNF
jgi:uroporphyrinogen decarboxylase